MLAASTLADILVAVGAIITAAAGLCTAYAAVVRAKNEGREECEKQLGDARAAAEKEAAEVHRWRMQYPGGLPPGVG